MQAEFVLCDVQGKQLKVKFTLDTDPEAPRGY